MAYTKTQLIDLAQQIAAQYGVDPGIAVAQINQESGFNPSVSSYQGAQGLAQFLPGTWAQYGEGSPFDPVAALNAYGRYMSHLLSIFGGDYSLALAGYHSGEGAARAALANPRGNPRTVNYVQTILAAAGRAFAQPKASPPSSGATQEDASTPQVKPVIPIGIVVAVIAALVLLS